MAIVILIAGILAAVALSLFLFGEKGLYRYDRVNPARRYCMTCGQQQDSFCRSIADWDSAWWEPMGTIKNPKCECHKDTKQ